MLGSLWGINRELMFRHYLISALRNLRKDKGHAAINVAGLSIGMAVSLLIAIWRWDEVSYNKCIPGYERIAQVMQHGVLGDA